MQYKNLLYKILIVIFSLFLFITLFSEENYDSQTGASIQSTVSNNKENNNSKTNTTINSDNNTLTTNDDYDTTTNASQKNSLANSNNQNTNNTNSQTTYTTTTQNNYDTTTNASEKEDKYAYNDNNETNNTTSTVTTTTTTIYHFTPTTTTSTTTTTVYHFTPTTTTSTTTTTVYHFTPTTTTSTTIYHFVTTTTLPVMTTTTTTTIANNQNFYAYNDNKETTNNYTNNEEHKNKTEEEYFSWGKELLLHSSFDGAIYNFTKALEKDQNFEYYYYRSIAFYANGDIIKAIQDAKLSILKDNTKYEPYIFYLYCTSKVSKKEFEIAKTFVITEQSKIKGEYGQKILKYFFGKSMLSDILKFNITTNLNRKQFICESYAYAGLFELLNNNFENAKTCFEISIETNEKDLESFYLSKIEYENILNNE